MGNGSSKGLRGRCGTDHTEFGCHRQLVSALQAISAEATPREVIGELTAEQTARRHPDAVQKLPKRIKGDLKAKTALSEALGQDSMLSLALCFAGFDEVRNTALQC